MSRLDDIDTAISKQDEQYKIVRQDIQNNLDRISRLKKFAEDTPAYLQTLGEEFENKTLLTDKEIFIMFIIVGLQILRQHFLTNFSERMDNQKAAQNTFGHTTEHSNRGEKYNPTFEEIITNTCCQCD